MELSWEVIAIAMVTIYIAEVYGSIIGGGSFLIQPILIMLGIPPAMAVVTDVTATAGASIGALRAYENGNLVKWKLGLWILVSALISGALGAQTLQHLPPDWIEKIIGVLALISVGYILYGKHDGTRPHPLPNFWRLWTIPTGLLIGFYIGISGAGTGILSGIILVEFFGLTHLQSIATRKVFSLGAKLTIIGVYFFNNLLIFELVVPMFGACLLAGYTSSHIALKIGNLWLKRIFIVVISGLAIWLLLK